MLGSIAEKLRKIEAIAAGTLARSKRQARHWTAGTTFQRGILIAYVLRLEEDTDRVLCPE